MYSLVEKRQLIAVV